MSASNIGRVYGQSLSNNLVRDGVPLQVDNGLLYFDVLGRKIGVNTTVPTAELSVDGNTFITGNIDAATGNLADLNVTGNATISTDVTISGNANISDITIIGSNISTTSGNLNLSSFGGKIDLGTEANVIIGGGSPDYVLTTDGAGNMSWQDLGQLSGNVGTTGMQIVLGTPTDSSLTANAAYQDFTTGTYVTDAIDTLNSVMLNVYKNTFVNSVNFTANITSGNSPLTVAFTSTHVGNPNTYYWDFGAANIAFVSGSVNTQNVTVTFNEVNGGLFSVALTGSNSNGVDPGNSATLTRVDYITIATPTPIASFTLNKTSLNSGTSVSLTNTSQYATDYVIYWGDGTTSTVTSNAVAGGVGGGAISHTYTNSGGDSRYNITLDAHSTTNGQTVTSSATQVKVYSTHTAAFSANISAGNNIHTFDGSGNPVISGLAVSFTNSTSTSPGSTVNFGAGNYYQWVWGDGTTSNVNVGSGSPGDTGTNITHNFVLSNPQVQQTFDVQLKVYNGHTSSPFASGNTTITVYPAPTAQFTGSAVTTSDRSGDTARTGYVFTDYLGNDRAVFTFQDTSINADVFKFTWGDGTNSGNLATGDAGGPTGGNITHTYSTTGNKTVSLLAYSNTRSLTASDDTLTRTNYISINATPSAPAALSTKTLSVTGGSSALLAAGATDNTSGNITANGSTVTRFTSTDPIASNTLTDVYNGLSGTLTAYINGSTAGAVTFTTGNAGGTYSNLVVSNSRDAHAADSATYPSYFYRVFTAAISKTNSSTSVGYNDYKLSHSSSGNTNVVGFVKDSVTAVPTVDIATATMTEATAGTLRYVSGVPYYNTGASVSLNGVKAYNWIGQCYLSSSTPFTVSGGAVVEGSGAVISSSQTKTYANLDGSSTYLTGGVPKANTGNVVGNSYTMGNISVSINGAVNSVGKLSASLQNLNGTSSTVTFPTLIQVQNSLTGFNEGNISVSSSLGAGFTDNGLRIYTGWTGATPAFAGSTNWYTGNAWGTGSRVVAGTDEAIVRYGTLQHYTTDLSSGYLPAGPDLASARSGTQYFRMVFRRTTMANFTVTYTGKISGFWIAAPGTQIDSTSTLNGWLDATAQYAGAGVPGANTGAGGNGSNGCAFDSSNKVVTGSLQSNKSCKLTLGSENASNAYGNNILITIALASGDSLTSLSIGP